MEDKGKANLRNPDDAERSVFERVKSIYPDYQEEKSTGFVLHTCAKFINSELSAMEPLEGLFFFELLIPLLILGVAYAWSLSLIRTVVGFAIFPAVLCFIGFVVVGLLLFALLSVFCKWMGGFSSFWAEVMASIAFLVPRILMFTGTWHEPKGWLLRAATDAMFVCGFLSIGFTLAWGFYRTAVNAAWNRRRSSHPVPWLLWALFQALECIAKKTRRPHLAKSGGSQ